MPALTRFRLAGLYVLVVVLWGTTWIAMRSAVATVPPLTASGLRFAIAAPLLAALVARRRGVPLRYPPGRRRLFVLVTIAYFTVPFALMTYGIGAVPSGLAAVLFATVAIFIIVLSVPVLKTRISRRQAGGVAVALAALVALIAKQAGLGGDFTPLGAAALLGAAGLHAAVYVLVKRDGGAIGPLTLNTLPMCIAALLLCAAGAIVERPDLGAVSAESLLSLLYLGAMASVAGFLAYFELLRRLGAVALSLVFVLFPVVAQVAAVLGGERAMPPIALALLATVLAGSAVALTGRPGERPARTRERRAPRLAVATADAGR